MSEEQEAPHQEPTEDQAEKGRLELKQVHIPFPDTYTYANCAAFAIAQAEIRVGFAEAMPDGTAVPKVGIVLTPESAAVIALVMLQQVKSFEENFGAIRHPLWKEMKAKAVSGGGLPPEVKQPIAG